MTKNSLYLLVLPGLLYLFPGTAQTVLQPGDLVIVGLASNVGGEIGGCAPGGSGQFQGRDRVSFICFQDLETGTAIDITDNGWERAAPGLWGNTEGFLRATRTGTSIPAGTLITFEFPPTAAAYEAIAPDGDWTFESLGNTLNFNDGGDQLYLMQGGDWDPGTPIGCCNGEQDARYTGGRILFGFNSKSTWNPLFDDAQDSALHPDVLPCYHMAPTSGVTSFTSYSGPMDEATQLQWIARIGDPGNWTAFPTCESYIDPPANFLIGRSGMSMDCRICQACEPFSDTLVVNLPAGGGPFSIRYIDGRDTFQVDSVDSGYTIPVTVIESTSFQLIRVTDENECPVYSNFESGADLWVSATQPVLECTPTAPAPDGAVLFSIAGGIAPYTIAWTDEEGTTESISRTGSTAITVTGFDRPGFYEVVLTDAGGCTEVCTFELEGPDCTLALSLDGINAACGDPLSGEISAVISGAQGLPTYQWNVPGISGPEASALPVGDYALTVTDEAGCRDSARVELIELDPLVLDLGRDQAVQRGQGVPMNPVLNFKPASVSWFPPEGVADLNSLFTTLSPTTTTQYVVTAVNQLGCSIMDSIMIRIVNEQKLFIPNVFSPNNDGVNDLFTLYPGPNVQEIRALLVFDRWGNLVYKGPSGEQRGWDGLLFNGEPAAAGTYLYFVQWIDQDGSEMIDKGALSLLR